LRHAQAGFVYHVLNRSNARLPLFRKHGDYAAFERVLAEAHARVRVPLLAYCLMPNHWHLLLWPQTDDQLSDFVGWLTLTHTQRWHAHHHTTGTGHLNQGRFKSFPVQEDEHFLRVCRYVERNALRAGLVARAEGWPWCSLAVRERGTAEQKRLLSPWPVACPKGWVAEVHATQKEGDLAELRECVRRGRPLGEAAWVEATVARLGLEVTLRPVGRPRKQPRAITASGQQHNNGPDTLSPLTPFPRLFRAEEARLPGGAGQLRGVAAIGGDQAGQLGGEAVCSGVVLHSRPLMRWPVEQSHDDKAKLFREFSADSEG
jgi:putative transposase